MHRSKTKRLNYCFLLLLFLTGNKKEIEEEAKRLVKEDQEENITSSAPERKKKKITTNKETTKKTLEQEIASAMHLINSDLQDGITSTQDGSTSTDTKPLPSLLLSQERSSNQQFPSPQQENTFYGNQSFTQQQSNFCLQPQPPQPPHSSFQPQLQQPQYSQHFSQQRVICEDDSYSLVRHLS